MEITNMRNDFEWVVADLPESFSLVVANGEFPDEDLIGQLVIKSDFIIACDGASDRLLALSITPDIIIGDCDSLSDKLLTQFKDRVVHVHDQNQNDLTKAFDYLVSTQRSTNVVVIGATGMREDHSIANMALLSYHHLRFDYSAFLSNYGILTAHTQCKIHLRTFIGQQVSFFTFDRGVAITCTQLKWPLDSYKLSSWNSGTLNEATDNYLIVVANGDYLVYRAFSEL